jgi:hypothetical protein
MASLEELKKDLLEGKVCVSSSLEGYLKIENAGFTMLYLYNSIGEKRFLTESELYSTDWNIATVAPTYIISDKEITLKDVKWTLDVKSGIVYPISASFNFKDLITKTTTLNIKWQQ